MLLTLLILLIFLIFLILLILLMLLGQDERSNPVSVYTGSFFFKSGVVPLHLPALTSARREYR